MSESNIIGLNRELRNSRIAYFISLLEYKCKEVIKVNPYNTSKMCNKCKKIHNIDLSIRVMDCECGNILDRDINAAKNINCLGQAILKSKKMISK
jgi:putative transposase